MKVLRKISFLVLILLSSSNLYSQYLGYKMPDQRQQKQQAWQTAKHLQKISTAPTARFERRHPHQIPAPSGRQKMLALLFATIIVNAEIAHSMSLISNAPKWGTPHSKKTEVSKAAVSTATVAIPISGDLSAMHLKPPIIHLVPYVSGQELETFGPCEVLHEGSKFCCNIGANYIVTCCVHPNATTGLSSCSSFDPVGIVGDQFEFHKTNFTEDILAAEKMCMNSYNIAEETQRTSKKKPTPNDNELRANATFVTNNIPTLGRIMNELAQNFNLQNIPQIEIVGNPDDKAALSDFEIAIDTYTPNSPTLLAIPIHFLRYIADAEQAAIYGHEFQHAKQNPKNAPYKKFNEITHNNFELEADIASVLVTGTPCNALMLKQLTFSIYKVEPSRIAELQEITQKDIIEHLSVLRQLNDHLHPQGSMRIVAMLVTYKKFKIVQALLLGEKK